jgi:hypothetical protein
LSTPSTPRPKFCHGSPQLCKLTSPGYTHALSGILGAGGCGRRCWTRTAFCFSRAAQPRPTPGGLPSPRGPRVHAGGLRGGAAHSLHRGLRPRFARCYRGIRAVKHQEVTDQLKVGNNRRLNVGRAHLISDGRPTSITVELTHPHSPEKARMRVAVAAWGRHRWPGYRCIQYTKSHLASAALTWSSSASRT